MGRFVHLQFAVRACVAVVYMVLQSVLAVHVIDHAADTPVERGCILCKFADNTPDIAGGAPKVAMPDTYVTEHEIPEPALPSAIGPRLSSIRAPPLYP